MVNTVSAAGVTIVGTRPTSKLAMFGHADELVACGPGVERITDEITARFPQARTAILSSDHAGGYWHSRDIKLIAESRVDIIVGTQIVAKGHHFKTQFVGVVDADLGLGMVICAAERTYQMLSQVAGRAGRETRRAGAVANPYARTSGCKRWFLATAMRFWSARRSARTGRNAAFRSAWAIIISATDQQEGLLFCPCP